MDCTSRSPPRVLAEEQKESLIQKATQALTARPEVGFAYLYGSFLEARPCRDIDIGIFCLEQYAAANTLLLAAEIDELQALKGIYINGQRELLKELFNFFVAMTNKSHLCHVLIASSDGFFIERIYNDSKLKKTSRFMEVAYLSKKDVTGWLSNLERESAIKGYTLTPEQIERAWQTFGGSCWEISRFLGDILMRAEGREGAGRGL